jgi:serine/threonine protein kinase
MSLPRVRRWIEQTIDSSPAEDSPAEPSVEAVPPLPRPTPPPNFDPSTCLDLGRLGNYVLLEELGRGGMGVVYKARHDLLGQVVALKVLPADRGGDAQWLARFHREIKALGALQHLNVATARDAGEAAGKCYLVMEYVPGQNLAEVLRRLGRLAVADACEVARQAALGLQHIHEHGLVHRDIKPSNLRLTPDGQVKVLDLGLANFRGAAADGDLTGTGYILGTADYMAPEQWADAHTADIRADLYSLGCTLYHLLTGRPPFGDAAHDSWRKKMMAHETAPVPPVRGERPEVPAELAAVLERLVAKQPTARFATPTEAAQALAPFCAGGELTRLLDTPDAPPSASSAVTSALSRRTSWSWQRGRRVALLAGLAAVVVVGAALAWNQFGGPGDEVPPDENGGAVAAPATAGRTTPPIREVRTPPPAIPLSGELDVLVWEPRNPLRQRLRPNQSLALPFKAGDLVRIEVRMKRPAYLYLVGLDSEGRATPYFPWQESDWSKLPAEAPRDRLFIPEEKTGAPIGDGPSGIETLILMARDEPLPAGLDVAGLFKGLPRQEGTPRLAAAAWFENGELVRDDPDRGPLLLDKARPLDDPVLITQAALRGRVRQWFPYTRAVCYSFQGSGTGK